MSARFSADRRYRYLLTREWNADRHGVTFVMLNPSVADEHVNDPTIERCQRRAVAMGFGALTVVNLFALVSTDPKMLLCADDPIGPDNDEAIYEACDTGMVVCAWGSDKAAGKRGQRVIEIICDAGAEPHAIKVNADGNPAHPLYQPYSRLPTPMPVKRRSRGAALGERTP